MASKTREEPLNPMIRFVSPAAIFLIFWAGFLAQASAQVDPGLRIGFYGGAGILHLSSTQSRDIRTESEDGISGGFRSTHKFNFNSGIEETFTPSNTSFVVNAGALTIATQPLATIQTACSFTISPTRQSFLTTGGSGTIDVTASESTCAWTASTTFSTQGWVTITSGSSGTGNGKVNYTVAANTGVFPHVFPRSGTISVAGKFFTVNQTACGYTIFPISQSFLTTGGSGTIDVTASESTCTWTATSNANWLTVTSGSSGTGNGTVNYRVAANTSTVARTGYIAVAGGYFTVNQAACGYTISPTSQSFLTTGGSGTIDVTASESTCTWTATSNANWVTVTSGSSGTGNGTVNYTVAANTSTVARTAHITIAGNLFRVIQTACSYTISPTSQSFLTTGGSGAVSVTTSEGTCAWTAISHANWITITSGSSGTGNGTVNYTVAANTSTVPRRQYITIAGNLFTVNQTACGYTISPTSQSFLTTGGSGTVSTTTSESTCTWTATSNPSWITVTSGSSGTGNGTVNYSVAANTSTVARTGYITVAGNLFTVNQTACSYTISPTSQSFLTTGGSGTVDVTTSESTCTWTATSNASWIIITSGSSGTGNGTVSYTVAANTSTVARTGYITIAGNLFTVNQAGGCSYSISPTSQSFLTTGGSGTVNVTASEGTCTWTAVSNASWIAITSASSGTGNGTVNYTVSANTSTVARTGHISIAGNLFTVNQAGGCTYSISPTSQTILSSGGAANVNVTTQPDCSWTAASNAAWITITSGSSGAGNGTVNYSVAANTGTSSRTATLTIAGQTFTVTQPGTGCTYSILPTSQSFGASSASGSVNVTTQSGCGWTAFSNASWITITSGTSGDGNGVVNYTVAANTTTNPRTGTLNIATQTFTVTQGAAPCTYSISPTTQFLGASGGSGTVAVTARNGCSWTAASNADWITITRGSSGSGSGTVAYMVASNTASSSRSGTMTIAGQTFTLTQAGTDGLPLGTCHPVTVQADQPLIHDIIVPEGLANLFILLQKETSWNGTLEVSRDGSVLNKASGYMDLAIQVPSPEVGRYAVRVSGSGSGFLCASTSLNALTLGKWTVGTIPRQWGSTWYQLDVPDDQATLFVAVETLGLLSRLEVFHGALGSPKRWAAHGDRMNLQISSPPAGTYYLHLTDSAWFLDFARKRDHQIKADVKPIDTAPPSDPVITSISPTKGGTGAVTMTIRGGGLDPNARVRLWLQTALDYFIDPQSVRGSSDKKSLTASFDFSSAVAGEYGLVVVNPNSKSVTAPDPFTIESGGRHQLWVNIVGREVIRVGRETTFTILYGNRGNVNAIGVPLWIAGIPKDATIKLGFEITPPPPLNGLAPIDWSQVPPHIENDIEKVIPLFVAQIPPGFSGALQITLTVPTNRQFQLRAWMNPPFFGSPIHEDANRCLDAIKTEGIKRIGELVGKLFGAQCAAAVSLAIPTVIFFGAEIGAPDWARITSLNQLLTDAFQAGLTCLGVALPPIRLLGTVAQVLFTLKDLSRECGDIARALTEAFLNGQALTSVSPEDKYGPTGYDRVGVQGGERTRFLDGNRSFDYRIDFWNKEDAPVPTQDVFITDQLDSDLDWSTFSFTEIGFLKWKVKLEGGQYFNVDVDLRPDKNLVVNVEGTFDPDTGEIRWEFHSLDPATRQPPEDPLAGFLPPITTSGFEIGWVNFTVKPKSGLPTGTRIENQAFVKFDVDVFKPAPPNGPFVNTIDAGAPTSKVSALPSESDCTTFTLSWTGNDDTGGSSVRDYTIFVSDNGAAYSPWLINTAQTSSLFAGQSGHTYSFYSIARDNVGNEEAAPAQADTSVKITGSLALSSTSQSFASTGGSGTVNVVTSSVCRWTAATNAGWIAITAGNSGTGNGSVTYTVAANSSSGSRTGTISIGGQILSITQSGTNDGCAFSSDISIQAFGAGGGNGSIRLTGSSGCGWTVTSNVAWITITSGRSGAGSGEVSYTVTANTSPVSRAGILTIAGKSFTIAQSGFGTTGIFYPRLTSSDGTSTSPDNSEYTGIAVANLGPTAATLTFTAFYKNGSLISGPSITNPTSIDLKAGEQTAVLDFQIFGSGLPLGNPVGWIKLDSTSSKTVGFFLALNSSLSILDGADVSGSTISSFVLPEIEDQGFTQIHVANPNPSSATINFELVKSNGTLRVNTVTRSVSANGAVAESFSQLFPGIAPVASDYIRVTSNKGVAPFEYLGKTAHYVEGLNGQDYTAGATKLYSPQYVVGGPDWRTTLSVVNLDSTSGTVSFKFIKDDGTQIGDTKVVPIAANGKIHITDQAFFLDAASALTQGYVEVTSSGVRLAGSVIFGDPARASFSSALPLVSTLRDAIVFSQVASNATYFTGIALLNPNDTDANATIDVFDKNGNVIASKQENIPAKRRKTQLLTEFFPSLVGRDITSGYIKVTVDKGVAAFSLFGTNNLSVLSAVPPQIVP